MADSIASFLMMQQLRSHSARVGDHGSEVDFYKPKQLQQDIKKEVSVSSITNPETETVAKVKTERNFEAKKIAEKAAKVGWSNVTTDRTNLSKWKSIGWQDKSAGKYIFSFFIIDSSSFYLYWYLLL